MPLFVCERCNVIENTALSSYWWSKKKLCSECDPEIGKWHGIFDKEYFNDKKWILKENNRVEEK